MTYSDRPRERVEVVCPTCHARLNPRAEWAGRSVRCPDCHSAVLVPDPRPAQPAPPPPRNLGEYGVRDPAKGAAEPPEIYLVVCPQCRARLHPRLDQVGWRARCPDCDTRFVLPPPRPSAPEPVLAEPGQYGLGAQADRGETPMEYLAVQVRRPAAEESAPVELPRLWLVKGVFDFPLQRDAADRLLILSLLGVAASGMTLFGLWVIGFTMLAAPFFALAAGWLWYWTISFGAACIMGIVQDTASRSAEVYNWPEGDWRTWTWPALYLGYQFALSVAAGYLAGLPLTALLGPGSAAVSLLVVFLLFPILLLSSMEADSPFMPYSPVVLAGLVRDWWAWAAVYAIVALSLGTWLVLTVAGLVYAPLLTVLFAVPSLAALAFIWARLLGRLACRAGTQKPKHPRRKRPPPKAALNTAGPGPA